MTSRARKGSRGYNISCPKSFYLLFYETAARRSSARVGPDLFSFDHRAGGYGGQHLRDGHGPIGSCDSGHHGYRAQP